MLKDLDLRRCDLESRSYAKFNSRAEDQDAPIPRLVIFHLTKSVSDP